MFELPDGGTVETVDGRTLYRICATEDNPRNSVRKGGLGGYVESVENLSGDATMRAYGRGGGGR